MRQERERERLIQCLQLAFTTSASIWCGWFFVIFYSSILLVLARQHLSWRVALVSVNNKAVNNNLFNRKLPFTQTHTSHTYTNTSFEHGRACHKGRRKDATETDQEYAPFIIDRFFFALYSIQLFKKFDVHCLRVAHNESRMKMKIANQPMEEKKNANRINSVFGICMYARASEKQKHSIY